ncbi:substrate-binding domain-containing protein [Acidisphaera rubrifaciens]|uniref:Methanol oxidation protein n=1 Tax=Acidisphaera rubrifaciens HS-AP3 TaxID=1231350 RepID=A0A0D6P3H3_9PROT|nr:substrate-binding domain-containing protein [Acidisphaera rubrifaciens]GAN76197.1 methanol oxidation protein [Acidisphaera rubrifaciens HS-AP3]
MHGLMRLCRFRRAPWAAAALALGLCGTAARLHAQGLGAGAELVDPDHFRVCADPRNLPFSNEQGQGFENKIAELLAGKLHRPVEYTYFPQVIGFFRVTLNADRCDVVMGVGVGTDMVQTTNPYYHTIYALVYPATSDLAGVDSMGDPRLKGKRIGVVARTPPATLLAQNGLMDKAKPYPLTVDTRYDAPAKTMMEDIEAGRIDAGVLWGPIAGYYALHSPVKLTVVPLFKDKGDRMDFAIAMGVRRSDRAWKRTLDRLISDNQDAINKILTDYGVPLLDAQGKPLKP